MALLALLFVAAASAAPAELSVHCGTATARADCRFSFGTYDRTATAAARYDMTTNATSGFATLDITSATGSPPRLAARACRQHLASRLDAGSAARGDGRRLRE